MAAVETGNVPEVDLSVIVDANKKFAKMRTITVEEALSACFPTKSGPFNYELMLEQVANLMALGEHAVLFASGKLSGPDGVKAVKALSTAASINKEPLMCSMVRQPIKSDAKGADNGCWWNLKGDDHFSAVVTESVGDKRNVPFLQPSKYASPGTIAVTPVYMSQTLFGTVRGRTVGRSAALTEDGSALRAKKPKEVLAQYRKEKLIEPKGSKKKGMKKGMKKAMKGMKKKAGMKKILKVPKKLAPMKGMKKGMKKIVKVPKEMAPMKGMKKGMKKGMETAMK